MDLKLAATEDELRLRFSSLKSRADVADLLEIPLKILVYHLYKGMAYDKFEVRKRSGGTRSISAPATALKIIQRKLNEVLHAVYARKNVVHGFVRERSILTNARNHTRSTYILNVDLQDFFPSINFGRVQGLFLGHPYRLPHDAATVLAQICCFERALPQGAPTSPIVSNMICGKLDSALKRLARERRCKYTRYADDITFSTTQKAFPREIAFADAAGLHLGIELVHIIRSNGFEVNPKKVRLQTNKQHQEVTGLTVNRFPNISRHYVRQIRAMLHAWQKYGEDLAGGEFFAKYDKKHRHSNMVPLFRDVVRGRIEFVSAIRGATDPLGVRLLARYKALCGEEEEPNIPPEQWDFNRIRKAIYVLETWTDDTRHQGTGFFLKGFGLITCAHVVHDGTEAFQPDDDKHFPVFQIEKGDDLDLARVMIAVSPEVELVPGSSDDLKLGDKISVYGYPEYGPGSTAHLNNGELTARRPIFGKTRLVVSPSIVIGNSGGPVLDAGNRVIGVAAKGASGGDHPFNEVIPIEDLIQAFPHKE